MVFNREESVVDEEVDCGEGARREKELGDCGMGNYKQSWTAEWHTGSRDVRGNMKSCVGASMAWWVWHRLCKAC